MRGAVIAWPDGTGPRRTPPEDEVVRPLVEFLGARFKFVRNGAAKAASYDGYPIVSSTCDDPERYFSDEHRAAREKDGRPFTTLVELIVLAAFELGREYERRMRRGAPAQAAPAPGAVGGIDTRDLMRKRARAENTRRYKDGRSFY
jgi:hypothetical protein